MPCSGTAGPTDENPGIGSPACTPGRSAANLRARALRRSLRATLSSLITASQAVRVAASSVVARTRLGVTHPEVFRSPPHNSLNTTHGERLVEALTVAGYSPLQPPVSKRTPNPPIANPAGHKARRSLCQWCARLTLAPPPHPRAGRPKWWRLREDLLHPA